MSACGLLRALVRGADGGDRGCVPWRAGNAKLQGLLTQLDLTGNRYNIALVRPLRLLLGLRGSD